VSTERGETRTQRLDRNWASLLQELRVAQTGVQVLTAFLLTLPFQSKFDDLNDGERALYLATVCCSVLSTVLLIAPVGMHRLLFRRRQLDDLVAMAHRFAIAGLLLLGLALAGAVALVFALVLGSLAAAIAGLAVAVAFTVFWVVVPVSMRRRRPSAP
jgi:hypothetical protein